MMIKAATKVTVPKQNIILLMKRKSLKCKIISKVLITNGTPQTIGKKIKT